jgi:hypothetical protein
MTMKKKPPGMILKQCKSKSIKRYLNNLQKWSKSDDNLKAPPVAVLTFRHIRSLLRFRQMLKRFSGDTEFTTVDCF